MKVNASKILIAIGVGATAINVSRIMVSAAYYAGVGDYMSVADPGRGDEIHDDVEACRKTFEEHLSISNFEKLFYKKVLERAYHTSRIAQERKECNHE